MGSKNPIIRLLIINILNKTRKSACRAPLSPGARLPPAMQPAYRTLTHPPPAIAAGDRTRTNELTIEHTSERTNQQTNKHDGLQLQYLLAERISRFEWEWSILLKNCKFHPPFCNGIWSFIWTVTWHWMPRTGKADSISFNTTIITACTFSNFLFSGDRPPRPFRFFFTWAGVKHHSGQTGDKLNGQNLSNMKLCTNSIDLFRSFWIETSEINRKLHWLVA